MKLKDALIVWTPKDRIDSATSPTYRKVAVVDRPYWDVTYNFRSWIKGTEFGDFVGWHRIGHLFILFNSLVVRDGIDPQNAHKEFLKIDEYRQRIARDTEGAED